MKKKILSAILAGSLLFGGGNALVTSAADNLTSFKEAYLATPNDNRTFRLNADFFGPSYRSEINSQAMVLRDATMRINGEMYWEFTNPNTNDVSSENIPFYITQDSNNMTLYAQRNGSWNRLALPAIPVGIVNALKTTEISILQQNMSAIKSVEVLRDTADQRSMKVTLDGKKLAELVKTYNNESSLNEDEKSFLGHIVDALPNTDLVCDWTVNKKDWKTVTAEIDFTKLVQAYGKDYLDDAAKGEIVLSQNDRSFYEVLGYYSELHFVMNYIPLNDESNLSMPSGAASARTNANTFDDLAKKIASTKR